MNDKPLPIIDNKTIFGGDYSTITESDLLPIGSIWATVSFPKNTTQSAFQLTAWKIEKHSAYRGSINGSIAGIANQLRVIDTWSFPATLYVYFMGEYRPVPPRILEPYLTSESLDLLRVIDAGLIDVPDEYKRVIAVD